MKPKRTGLAGIVEDVGVGYCPIYFDTPEWEAFLEWLEFHSLDPKTIPAPTAVVRDAPSRCIRYVRLAQEDEPFEVFDHLRVVRAVEQGEAPPLPLPDLILAAMNPERIRR